MTELLTEGGIGGHMPHLYENGNLTFKELKNILKMASKGELEGTEKTDGQNLYLSYDVAKRVAVGARNVTDHIKSGGLSVEEMTAFFKDHPNPYLQYTFSDAIKIFEKAINKIGEKDLQILLRLFYDSDPQTGQIDYTRKIWYNAEVLDDRTPNVISYDTRNLLIHRTNHKIYDKKQDKIFTAEEIDKKAAQFMNVLQKVQDEVSSRRHSIAVNPIRNLKALDNKEALRIAYSELDKLLSQSSLNDDNTINDYLEINFNKKIQTFLPEDIKNRIIKTILGIIAPNKRELKKNLTQEARVEVDEIFSLSKELYKQVNKPLETIITDFASEMLKTLESIFILDNKKSTEKLRTHINSEIEKIRADKNISDITKLERELEKLKGVESVQSAVEGFAFSYNGIVYKFTGKFAPINQILGIKKYSKKDDSLDENLKEEQLIKEYDTALLAGGFKPPHKGHIELIKQLAKKADKVYIFTSAKDSKQRSFESGQLKGKVVNAAKCNEYLQKMINIIPELNNVKIIVSPQGKAPLGQIMDYIKENSKYSESILIGVGAKFGKKEGEAPDIAKFKPLLDKDEKFVPKEKNLSIKSEILPPVLFNGEALSASRLREAISNNNTERVVSFLPNEIDNKVEFAQEMIQDFLTTASTPPTKSTKKTVKEEVFEQVLNIFTNSDKLEEISSVASGAISGPVSKTPITRKKKMKQIDRKVFMEELQLRKLIRKALILREQKKNNNTEEQKLRNIIRDVINEAKREISYGNTGLNVLANLLGGSFKDGLKSAYKDLETEKSQRDRFRAKYLELSQKFFDELELNIKAGNKADGEEDADALEEETNLVLDEPVDDKILPDIVYGAGDEKKKSKAKEGENVDKAPFEIKKAVEFFNSWSNEVEKDYTSLDNNKDRQMYRDYFMSNVAAMLDVAEAEVSKKITSVNTAPPAGAQTVQSTEPATDQENQGL